PLGEELAHSLIPSDMCVEDARYILDYFRLSADKRTSHPVGDRSVRKATACRRGSSSRDRDLHAARPAGVLPIGRALHPSAGQSVCEASV
ncbi:hypothetical protein NKH71_32530, partial [Mesorhizobium sp. M0983]|uniref:hypothetical protein n=1 Tax=Mesorhizobium sp. M0983 TaxID=2957040 RepID=UPI003339446D